LGESRLSIYLSPNIFLSIGFGYPKIYISVVSTAEKKENKMLTMNNGEMEVVAVDARSSIEKIKSGAIIVPFEGQIMAWKFVGDEINEVFPVDRIDIPRFYVVEGTFQFMYWDQYWVLSPFCFQYWKNLFTLRFLKSVCFALRSIFDNGERVYWPR
jgi:hypothetical protein